MASSAGVSNRVQIEFSLINVNLSGKQTTLHYSVCPCCSFTLRNCVRREQTDGPILLLLSLLITHGPSNFVKERKGNRLIQTIGDEIMGFDPPFRAKKRVVGI